MPSPCRGRGTALAVDEVKIIYKPFSLGQRKPRKINLNLFTFMKRKPDFSSQKTNPQGVPSLLGDFE
jgi:hypothetical protein